MAVSKYEFSHIEPTYSFADTNDENRHIHLILKALLHCRAFYHLIYNCQEENKVIELFKQLFEDIKAQQNANDIDCRGIVELINTTRNFECLHFMHPSQSLEEYKKYYKTICMISRLLNESSIYKLFTLTRSIYGYCKICDLAEESPVMHNNIIYYASGLHYNEFDLEDSLYAERYKERYTCNDCGTIYNFKVAVTVKVPEILIVMAEYELNEDLKEDDKKIPNTLTIPCSDTMTYVYKLSSYIEYDEDNKNNYINLYRSDGGKARNSADSVAHVDIDNTHVIKKHHFFYTKAASVYNYKKRETLY